MATRSSSFGNNVVRFNKGLKYTAKLPKGFAVLNPFTGNPETMVVMKKFYDKFYSDSSKRWFIIGINPSRHGAGVTGVPFTDTKRLADVCGIQMKSAHTHEVSSVFMYEMIKQYGGPEKFYSKFYINSPFPLAIVRNATEDKWLNANYYDDAELYNCVKDYMIETLRNHISMGLHTSVAFVLGKKNADFIRDINNEHKLFGELVVLDHPRYIQQYKSKQRDLYIDMYLRAFEATNR